MIFVPLLGLRRAYLRFVIEHITKLEEGYSTILSHWPHMIFFYFCLYDFLGSFNAFQPADIKLNLLGAFI